MIQRIQSIYLLLVVLVQWVAGFCFFYPDILTFVICVFSGILALITIFCYKNRQNQFVFNRINILINLILLGVFTWRALNSLGEISISEKSVQVLVPIISIVFLFLANKAIRRDEDLVKSADRLR
ncbi:MAG: DUF4293 family protein [Capnocytophaga sp.]|nr:DUF4293 family protein [Capnocytophaga sp.]